MNIVTKDFPVIPGGATDEYPNGSFEVILSAPTVDRDGEVIETRAFDPLPSHVTFDTDHSMTCDTVVGSGTPYYAEDGTLRVKGGFAADARSQTIRQKVTDGHIRTTSVTFMAAERQKDDKGVVHIKRAELLNGTFTPIPSNREAVVLTAKSIMAKEGRRNNAEDVARLQSMHDMAVEMGAACTSEKSHDVPDEKTAEPDEVITSDSDADSETDETLTSADSPADEAAADEAAADSAGKSADLDAEVALARLTQLEHTLGLL